jgi:hypothetical protein
MIFNARPEIKQQFDSVHNFGIQNLIVSGCSFTHNNSQSTAVAWPYYLKDFGGFQNVFDTSMPGAGNYHISNSLIWALEQDQIDPANSLVIIMWSGCDRDDFITSANNIKKDGYSFRFEFNKDVWIAINGGTHPDANGNTADAAQLVAHGFFTLKTRESKSIENYLTFLNTWHYLKNRGFRCVFLNFIDPKLPSRTRHFDIRPYLPTKLQTNLDSMFSNIVDPYSFALRNGLLWDDDFHPSADGHLEWTRNILMPHLQKLFD